jgi:hypothetical protein
MARNGLRKTKGTVVVAGSLAQKPRRGGHTWVLLQYLLGFRQLGWNVRFLDRLEPGMCINAAGEPASFRSSLNLQYFLEVIRRAGLEGAYSLDYNSGECRMGLSRQDVLARVKEADCLINVLGFLNDDKILAAAKKRVFLDIDPGFCHMWQALGLVHLFGGYQHHVSIARNIGTEGCSIPACELNWMSTAQPVVLSHWPSCADHPATDFTTVAAWRGSYAPVEYQGKRYGLRVHEFRKFAELPRLTRQSFRVALDMHEADASDRAMLQQNGWALVDPIQAAGDPWLYQEYIRRSAAEIMVAKNMYVESNSGWFSDRSICYLASGRPVLAQDTGIAAHYPNREGIVTFKTLDDAAAGAESIVRDYRRHAKAARTIAEEHFDSNKVLSTLMDRLAGRAARFVQTG